MSRDGQMALLLKACLRAAYYVNRSGRAHDRPIDAARAAYSKLHAHREPSTASQLTAPSSSCNNIVCISHGLPSDSLHPKHAAMLPRNALLAPVTVCCPNPCASPVFRLSSLNAVQYMRVSWARLLRWLRLLYLRFLPQTHPIDNLRHTRKSWSWTPPCR
jgi:hypothetical protein